MGAMVRLAGWAVLACLLAGCDLYIPFTGAEYQRWSAPGRYGAQGGSQNVYWLDDERVLYLGYDEGAKPMEATLRIWTVATGAVEVLGPASAELCHFKGYVRLYESEEHPFATIREGRLGATTTQRVHFGEYVKSLSANKLRKHPFDCRYFSEREYEPFAHCKVPLLPGDGYLFYGRQCDEAAQRVEREMSGMTGPDRLAAAKELLESNQARAVRFVTPHATAPVELAIENVEMGSPRYSEWLDRYVLAQARPKGDRGITNSSLAFRTYRVYLLSRDGSLEWIDIPSRRYFLAGPPEVVVTRAGLVARSPGVRPGPAASIGGVVLYRNGKPEQLDDGWTQEMALSPSGCRLAYEKRVRTKTEPLVITLHAIDVCRRTK